MKGTWRGWLPVALGLVLVGCSGDAEVATTPFPAAAATPVVEVSTAEPEPTGTPTSDPTPIVEPTEEMLRKIPSRPVNSDEDVREVYDDLVEAAAALSRYPDPERVKDVYSEHCACYTDFVEYAQRLTDDGLYVDRAAIPIVTGFQVLRRDTTSFAVKVTAEGDGVGNALRSASGDIVEKRDGVWEREMTITASADAGLWRFTGLSIDSETGFE